MDIIIATPSGIAEMRKHLEEDKKIAAIKALRRTAIPPNGEKMLSLRDAKMAVERFQYETLHETRYKGSVTLGKPITAGPVIKEIVCDFGGGPVTVDVETMELKALSQLESIGLEACGHMLELCQAIKAFSEGKKIGVIGASIIGDDSQ
tara:strand:- start:2175 stop:2621 length:447 start_codon:yes stop_codon:yes gene_type:complete